MNFAITLLLVILGTVPSFSYASHNAGELLYGDNVVTVHNANFTSVGHCGNDFYYVSAIFDVNRDYVFTTEFIKKHIPRDKMIKLKKENCTSSSTTNIGVYIKDVFLNIKYASGGVDSVFAREITKGSNAETPFFKVFISPMWGYTVRNPLLGNEASSRLHHEGKLIDNVLSPGIASVKRYLSFVKRDHEAVSAGYTFREALIKKKKDRLEDMSTRLQRKYGISLQSPYFTAILDGNDEVVKDINLSPFEKWRVLRTYIRATSEICKEKTVEKPKQVGLVFGYEEHIDTGMSVWC